MLLVPALLSIGKEHMLCRHSRSLSLEPRCMAVLTLFCLLLAVATPAQAQFSINTIPLWNGTSFISSFGVTDTATYGETITVPAGASPLNAFSFEIGNCGANVTMRGEVYAWNGTMATGAALYESAPFTLTDSAAFQLVTFTPGSLTLPAGQYVLFASTSKDQSGAQHSACRWGALTNDTGYTGGAFVFMNNTANAALWTTNAWSNIAEDLAFQVTGLSAAVPAASTTSLLIGALALTVLGIVLLSRSRLRA